MVKVCVVIPTYNEAGTIESIINSILKTSNYEVIVVDDGSPDGTAAIVETIAQKDSRVKLINRGRKMGLGSAYQEGFRTAIGSKADVVVSMDADGSHPPELIPELVKAVETQADVAIASRYVRGGKWSASRKRMVISRGANTLARLCLGTKLNDMTSGYRAYSSKAVEHILKKDFSKGYVFQVEIIHRLARAGFKIAEIPFVFRERVAGESKLSAAEIARFLFVCLRILASRLTRPGSL
ncbi:MAG: polyprenol monophosphomannose synthase [Candidatus Caldarchaeum sp.]|nr:polyprenol monophosphomannose synthase [Candidatus Caldarchaeum sp.]